jgi:hypothetical protein
MKSARRIVSSKQTSISIGPLSLWIGIILTLGLVAVAASAQTVLNQPTTTTLWAGTADFTADGLASFTLPSSGVILTGSALSSITGKPVRHLWYGDAASGICRIDPELDAVVPPAAGIGGHASTFTTCVGVGAISIVPGQLAFDASTNTLYTVNMGRTSPQIVRMSYVPTGDNGQGTIDPLSIQGLIGGTLQFACLGPKDPKTGNTVPIVPSSAAIGPDGNLYVGSIRDGAIIRILSPATFNPGSADCQNKVQIPILSPDEAFGSGHTFGLGWIGHTLFGGDNIAPWALVNADQCLTPANSNKVCGAPALGGAAPMPTEIPGILSGAPQAAAVSDAQYPSFPGSAAYFAGFPSVTRLENFISATNLTYQPNFGSPAGGFCFITGLTADSASLPNETLYVGVDCAQGAVNGAGAIYQVTSQDCAVSAAPLAPLNVTAAATGNGQITVNWFPATNCQPITSYTVRALLANGSPSAVPDSSVLAGANGVVPTVATITALTNGSTFEFEVEACNSVGCSPFSAVSNLVLLSVPGTPTGVTAVAGNNAATVSWVAAQAAAGAPPVTSYTVSAFDSAAPTVVASTATAPASGALVSGLINGHTYTFSVHATNAVGNSAESSLSGPITLPLPSPTDMAVTVSAPASVNASPVGGPTSTFTVTMTVTNKGPANAGQVTLTGSVSPTQSFAPIQSVSTTSGTCQVASATNLTCNLGAMNNGASATVSVVVFLSSNAATVTSTGTVSAALTTGAVMPDPVPSNNTASAATIVNASGPPPPPPPSTTDIQVVGSAQNGGPAVGSSDTFTWQIKDNQGTTAANGVVFTSTLPSSFVLGSVTPNQGTCSNVGNAITCNLGTINGGATAIVSVNFTPTVAGTFSTTGSATFSGTDSNPANNSFTVTISPK